MKTAYTDLEKVSISVREDILRIIRQAGAGHIGGSLSSTDILVALYFRVLNIDPKNPEAPDRDRFILSKGHSVEGFYSILARAGFFPEEELATYGSYNTRLYGHPTMKVPGVEIPSGSLGHGLSVGVGQAIAAKRSGQGHKVYVLMGDGEQAEGSLWEAAMSATHYRLDNLIGIIDYNKLQISGRIDEVMSSNNLGTKWKSFGWEVLEINGHNYEEIVGTFSKIPIKKDTPHMVIAHTVKGKGISFIEDRAEWHHKVPTEEQYIQGLEELARQRGLLDG